MTLVSHVGRWMTSSSRSCWPVPKVDPIFLPVLLSHWLEVKQKGQLALLGSKSVPLTRDPRWSLGTGKTYECERCLSCHRVPGMFLSEGAPWAAGTLQMYVSQWKPSTVILSLMPVDLFPWLLPLRKTGQTRRKEITCWWPVQYRIDFFLISNLSDSQSRI